MLKKILLSSLFFLLFVEPGPEAAEAPRLAPRIPQDAAAAVFIRDLPALARGRAWMSSLTQAFDGEVAIAIFDIPTELRMPPFIVVGEVNPGRLQWFLDSRLKPILQRNLGNVEFNSSGDITEIAVNGSPTAFYAVRDNVLWFSLDRNIVSDRIATLLPADNSLRANRLFMKVLEKSSPNWRSLFFLDYQKVLEAFAEKMPKPGRDILRSTGILDIQAWGGFTEVVDGAHAGSLVLLTSEKPRGFLALAGTGAAEPKAARYVPADYSAYLRLRFSSFSDAWKQIKETIQQIGEDEAQEGIADFLGQFRESTGCDFEKDVLNALGGEVALAVAVPEKLRIPDAVILLEITNKEKLEKLIGHFVPEGAAQELEYKGTRVRTVNLGRLPAAYGFLDNYLVVGTNLSAIKSVVDAKAGASLADNTKFRAALERLGGGNHLFYLDLGSTAPLYLTAIAKIANARGRSAIGREPPKWETVAKLLISPLLTDIVLACSISGDEEGVTLRGYSTFSGTYRLAAGSSVMAGMMLPALSRARESARRAVCLNNLKQLAVAEKMYAADHEGKFSQRLSDLYPDYVTSLDVFTCPSERGAKITRKEDIDERASYMLRGGLTEESPAGDVLIYENPWNHRSGGGGAAFIDGHVRWLSDSELERIVDQDEIR